MAETQLEKYFEGIINIFHQYSVRVEHFDMLSKGELKKLIEQQLPTFLKNKKNPQKIDSLFEELDKDKNQQICFGEFMVFISRALSATHEHIHHQEDHGHTH